MRETLASVDPGIEAEPGACNLRWVHDGEGVVRHVSEFAGTPVGHRPRVTCVGCGEPLTLRLGTILTHHAAHKTSSRCPMSTPEGAAHINTKLAIQRGFSRAKAVLVRLPCAGLADDLDAGIYPAAFGTGRHSRRTCWHSRTFRWVRDWDEVKTEVPVGRRVADVAFLCEGRVIAVIEVFHRHAVREDKAADYAEVGVPWLEVAADPRVGALPDGWDPGAALDPIAIGPWDERTVYRCDPHADQYAAIVEERRHVRGLLAVRLVDAYDPDGQHTRGLVSVYAYLVDGAFRQLSCSFMFEGARVDAPEPAPEQRRWWPAPEAVADGGEALLGHLDRELAFRFRCAPPGAWFDSPMAWMTGSDAERLVDLYAWATRADPLGRTRLWGLRHAYPPRAEWQPSPHQAVTAGAVPADQGSWVIPPEFDGLTWAPRFETHGEHPAYLARVNRAQSERLEASRREQEEREVEPLRAWLETVAKALAGLPFVRFGGARVHALDQEGPRGAERLVFVPVPAPHLLPAARVLRTRGEHFVSAEWRRTLTAARFSADVEAAQDPDFRIERLRAVAVTPDFPLADRIPTLVVRPVPFHTPELRLGADAEFRPAPDVVQALAAGTLRWREHARPGAHAIVVVASAVGTCPRCRGRVGVHLVTLDGFVAACGRRIGGGSVARNGGAGDLLGFSLATTPYAVGDVIRAYRAGKGGHLAAEWDLRWAQGDLPERPPPALFGEPPARGAAPPPLRCPTCGAALPTSRFHDALTRHPADAEVFDLPIAEWRVDPTPVGAPHWCESTGAGCDLVDSMSDRTVINASP